MRRRQFNQTLALTVACSPLSLPTWGRSEGPALLLAQKAPAGIRPAGYLVSEKLDGVRAFWDGRQLLSRSGHVLAAPGWFSERLPPNRPLDGELWMGRGRFEAASAAVRRSTPKDEEWRQLRYMLFELPDGEGGFEQRYGQLQALAEAARWEGLQAVPQERIDSPDALRRCLALTVAEGGEGLMLHRANAPYRSGRSEVLLKLKPEDDEEAVVLAQVPGQGRFQGMLGALRVRNAAGVEFLLGSGFSEAQRRAPPVPGSVISYRYRGLTAKGVPRFASFLRVQDEP